MSFNLDSIKVGGTVRPPRIILLGTEKIGKSTFAAGSDRPVFLPIRGEEGIDEIKVPQFPTCNHYDDVRAALTTLYEGEHNHGTGILDSTSTFENLIHLAMCQKFDVDSIEKVMGGYGKGYTEAVNWMRKITEMIDAIRERRNMSFILIGHVEVKTFNDPAGPSYEHYIFDVHQKLRNMLYRWADVILFANTKTSVKVTKEFGKDKGKAADFTGGGRFLYTQKRPAHPGGGRGVFGQLPYELPLDWNAFMNAVRQVLEERKT